MTLSETATAPPEALDRLGARLSRVVEPDHVQVALIGESLARRGVLGVFDVMLRDPRLPPNSPVLVVAGGTAFDALSRPKPGSSSPASFFMELLNKTPSGAGTEWVTVPAYVAYRTLTDPMRALALPAVAPKDGRLVGFGVFTGDRLTGLLGIQDAWALTILASGIQSQQWRALSVPFPDEGGGEVGLWLVSSRMNVTAEGPRRFRLAVSATAYGASATMGTALDIRRRQTLHALEQAAGQVLARRLADTLAHLQQLGADPTGLGHQLWQACHRCFEPTAYRRLFPTLTFDVTAEVHLRSPGMVW